jgi:hypothetical protein
MSSGVPKLSTKSRNSGLLVHSHGAPSRLPYARTNRPGADRRASTAASPCSTVRSPWDQSTVVVTPVSTPSIADSVLPAWTSAGRKILPQLR